MNKHKSKEQIVVFDFDKTITSVDTFSHLIAFLINSSFRRQCFALFFLPIIYTFKSFESTRVYAASLGLWVGSIGKQRRYLINRIKEYSVLYRLFGKRDAMRLFALNSIKKHINIGHRVIIVSASSRLWIKHFLGSEISSSVTIIGSEIEYRWYGLVLKSWCYGKDKLKHLEKYNIPHDNLRTMYSDSITDIDLMACAKNRCFVNISSGLKKFLKSNGDYYFISWPC